jgi:tripartite-type tricarboxylate transporter receptor subunit TctC
MSISKEEAMERRGFDVLAGIIIVLLFCVLALPFLAGTASGADYPKGPISMMIPFTPGGASDTTARAIAAAIEPILKVPVVSENKTGGGGSVGWMWLSRQKPDGYNIGLNTVSMILQQYTGASGVKISEFEPISMIAYADSGISVPTDSPFKTLKDLIEYARKNPGKVRISNSGTGSIWHLSSVALEGAAGVQFTHVPFKGGKDGVVAMLGKHVEAAGSAVGEVAEFVKAGRARILGIASPDRFAGFPDVPTFQELGYKVEVGCLFGLVAPKGTPKEIIKMLDEAVAKGVKEGKYVTIQNNFGNRIRYLNSEGFGKLMKLEDGTYHALIKKVGLENK